MRFNFLLISLVLALSGCATTQPIVNPQIIPPSAELISTCSIQFKKVDIGSFDEIKNLLVDERNERIACIRKDKAKKEYILRQLTNK